MHKPNPPLTQLSQAVLDFHQDHDRKWPAHAKVSPDIWREEQEWYERWGWIGAGALPHPAIQLTVEWSWKNGTIILH